MGMVRLMVTAAVPPPPASRKINPAIRTARATVATATQVDYLTAINATLLNGGLSKRGRAQLFPGDRQFQGSKC